MSTIIYNTRNEIIGDISKSNTDKGYWFAGFYNKRGKRVVEFFKGKTNAINFLKNNKL